MSYFRSNRWVPVVFCLCTQSILLMLLHSYLFSRCCTAEDPEETGLTPPEQESRHRVRHSEPTHCSGHPSKQENSSRSARLPSRTGLQTPHLTFWSPGCFTRASSGLRSRKAEYFPNCKHQSVPSAFSKPPRRYKTGSNPMHSSSYAH